MQTRVGAAVVVAMLAAVGCSGGSTASHASLITAADLGGGWSAGPVISPASLHNGCESAAFNRFPPTTSQSRTWTRPAPHRPGAPRSVTEYLLAYDSSDAAADGLSTYRDFVPQCTAGGHHETQVTLPSLNAATTVNRGQGHPALWHVFAVGGDHAAWLVVTGGSKDDIDSLTESAVRRLG